MPKIFRSEPTTLSEEEVKTMLKKYDFFDYNINREGHGFANQFEVQLIKDDKIVIDRASDLMWHQEGSSKHFRFKKAKQWLEEFNQKGYAGYRDWRLPTLEEAMSLMEREKKNDNLYIDSVFNDKQRWIWTCDLIKGLSWMWVINFDNGFCFYHKLCHSFWIQAVRSIQSSLQVFPKRIKNSI